MTGTVKLPGERASLDLEALLNKQPLAHQRIAAELAMARHWKRCIDRVRAAKILKGAKLIAAELIFLAWDAFEAREVKAEGNGILVRTTLNDLSSASGVGGKTVRSTLEDLRARGIVSRLEINQGRGRRMLVEIGDLSSLIQEMEQLLCDEKM